MKPFGSSQYSSITSTPSEIYRSSQVRGSQQDLRLFVTPLWTFLGKGLDILTCSNSVNNPTGRCVLTNPAVSLWSADRRRRTSAGVGACTKPADPTRRGPGDPERPHLRILRADWMEGCRKDAELSHGRRRSMTSID